MLVHPTKETVNKTQVKPFREWQMITAEGKEQRQEVRVAIRRTRNGLQNKSGHTSFEPKHRK